MQVSAADTICRLQHDSDCIRNICVMAHVDHGKTSICDNLIATNGLISARQCGDALFLDSRDDEKERGITMKASAISLKFTMLADSPGPEAPSSREHLLNLVDTPGHADFFSSDVTSVSRICEGALVLVDAAEGFCAQTHKVLEHVRAERLIPVLVINKVDRLVHERGLTPAEAYDKIAEIVMTASSIMRGSENDAYLDSEKNIFNSNPDDEYFNPSRGNVVIASATQRWGFRIPYFARLHAKRLGVTEKDLLLALWGDEYVLDSRQKKIIRTTKMPPREKHLAVRVIFENIWSIYEACGVGVRAQPQNQVNQKRVLEIAKKLGAKITEYEINRIKDGPTIASRLLSHWLPVSSAIFAAIAQIHPSPKTAQRIRFPLLIPSLSTKEAFSNYSKNTLDALFDCKNEIDSNNALVCGYIAKPISTQEENSHQTTSFEGNESTQLELNDSVTGLARLYCGRLRIGTALHIKINDTDVPEYTVTVKCLYLLLGRGKCPVEEVQAGSVFGIEFENSNQSFPNSGSESVNLLDNTSFCTAHNAIPYLGIVKIQNYGEEMKVRVAIEANDCNDMNILVTGLYNLQKTDPFLKVNVESNGEYIITATGDVHLEVCIHESFSICKKKDH
jgi:ribosome assembly protein 1